MPKTYHLLSYLGNNKALKEKIFEFLKPYRSADGASKTAKSSIYFLPRIDNISCADEIKTLASLMRQVTHTSNTSTEKDAFGNPVTSTEKKTGIAFSITRYIDAARTKQRPLRLSLCTRNKDAIHLNRYGMVGNDLIATGKESQRIVELGARRVFPLDRQFVYSKNSSNANATWRVDNFDGKNDEVCLVAMQQHDTKKLHDASGWLVADIIIPDEETERSGEISKFVLQAQQGTIIDPKENIVPADSISDQIMIFGIKVPSKGNSTVSYFKILPYEDLYRHQLAWQAASRTAPIPRWLMGNKSYERVLTPYQVFNVLFPRRVSSKTRSFTYLDCVRFYASGEGRDHLLHHFMKRYLHWWATQDPKDPKSRSHRRDLVRCGSILTQIGGSMEPKIKQGLRILGNLCSVIHQAHTSYLKTQDPKSEPKSNTHGILIMRQLTHGSIEYGISLIAGFREDTHYFDKYSWGGRLLKSFSRLVAEFARLDVTEQIDALATSERSEIIMGFESAETQYDEERQAFYIAKKALEAKKQADEQTNSNEVGATS